MPLLKPGQIVLLDVLELDKQKYFLVAGFDSSCDGPLLFYISSRLFDYAQTRPYLWPFQIRVTREQHPFMPKDESWMNCTEVCIDHSWTSIEYMLRHQLGVCCGTIHADAKAKVIEAVKNEDNETISPKHRGIILASLI